MGGSENNGLLEGHSTQSCDLGIFGLGIPCINHITLYPYTCLVQQAAFTAPFTLISSALLELLICLCHLHPQPHCDQASMLSQPHPRNWSWLCAAQRSEVDFVSLRLPQYHLILSASGVQDLLECNPSFLQLSPFQSLVRSSFFLPFLAQLD